jgi:threonine dehydrogenase-like Zn-dependent dehydrogenase
VRAVVFASQGRVLVDTVEEPRILEPPDALVRVRLAGICGTDLHLAGGDLPGIDPGTVMGHEFVGDVVEIGAAVRSIRTGDRVCGSDFTACGVCRWCARGEHWECPQRRFFGSGRAFGLEVTGAQAELVRIPFADVVSVAAHATPSWPFPLARAFAGELALRFAIGDAIRYRNKLFALIAAGVLDPRDVVEERVALDAAPLAYERMANGALLKAVIDPRS